MPTCGQCNNPCTCLVSEDGFFANRPTDGRANTVVTGRGTPSEPFTVSFVQSEFYRPESGELKQTNTFVLPDNSVNNVSPTTGFTFGSVYQSPGSVFVSFTPVGSSVLTGSFGHFKYLGASATFSANATGIRYMSIIGSNPWNLIDYVVAGNSSLGDSVGPSVLNCAGFTPGVFDPSGLAPIFSNTGIQAWGVGIWQTSGGNLNVTDIKFWMTTI